MEYSVDAAVLDGWNIMRLLGEGSYGKVFEIERSEFGQTYRAALKVITVPQSSAEVRSVISEGMSVSQAEAYFHGIVEELMHEFSIMFKLKGTANVVSCEDLRVLEHPDGIGWDILIRMELLHPLLPYVYQHPMARRDIIRLGIDICKALELCQRYNIIHRDIKSRKTFLFPTTGIISSAISASRGRSNARPPACPRRARIVTWPRRSTLERNMASASTRIRSDWCCTGC